MTNTLRFAAVAALAFGLGWSLRTPVHADAGDVQDRSMRALERIADNTKKIDDIADRVQELGRVIERSGKEIKVTCPK